MKTLILSILLTASQAIAGLPPTTLSGQSDTTKTTTFNFKAPYNQATKIDGSSSLIETGNGNLLLNPGFEHQTFSTSWTVTAGTPSVDTTNMTQGKQAMSLSLSAVNGTIVSQNVTPTIKMSGISMEHIIWVKTALTNIQACSLQAGSEVSCSAVPSTDLWSKVSILATGPASGSVGVRIKSTSGATGTVLIDAAYVGAAISSMNNPMTTGGDVIYGGASGTPTRLANGSSGNLLSSAGGTSAPAWAALSSLAGSVTSGASGALRIEYLQFGGAASGGLATSSCTSTPCTIAAQSGSWISSVARGSAGSYTATIAGSVFSAVPYCVGNAGLFGVATGGFANVNATSVTVININAYSNAGTTLTDNVITIICFGPR